MAPLSQAGQELIRNRTAQVVDAGRRAKAFTSDAAAVNWHENDDWRVRLGSSIALARHGAKSAPCAPEVRELLFSGDEEVRKLAEATLCGDAAGSVVLPPVKRMPETPRRAPEQEAGPSDNEDPRGAQNNVERVRQLLASSDSRVRRGALEALGKQRGHAIAQYTVDVAALLADPSVEVQQAAAAAVMRIGSSAAPAVADILCSDDTRRPTGEQLLLQLASGDSHRMDRLLRDARARLQPRAEPVATENTVRTILPTTNSVQEFEPSITETLQPEVVQFEAEASPLPLRPQPPSEPLPTQQRPRIGASKTQPVFGSSKEVTEVPKAAFARGDPLSFINNSAMHLRMSALTTIGRKTVEEAMPFLSAVVEKLQDEDEHVCAFAAETLGVLGTKGLATHSSAAGIPEAVSAKLSDSHSAVRQASARALGRIGAHQTAQALARLLEDDNLQVQREAVLALGAFPPAAMGAIVAEQLRHSDPGVRAAAKKALCLAASNGSQTPEVSLAAMRPHLEPVLAHQSPEVRRSAAEVIERVARATRPSSAEGGPKATAGTSAGIRSNSPDLSKMMSTGIQNIGSGRRASLAASCGAALLHDGEEEVREAAARRLGKLGADAAPSAAALARCLEDTSPTVRRAAAEVIAELGQEHGALAATRAAELLRHPLQTVRRAASYALCGLGEAGEIHSTTRNLALLTDPDPTLRCNAVEALGYIGARGNLGIEQVDLLAALHIDRHWCVRLAVADALHHCGADALRSHEAALKLLATDSDWRVQRAAIAAMKDAAQPPGAAAERQVASLEQPEFCKCGSLFMADSVFCRKCGRRRVQDNEPQVDVDESADTASATSAIDHATQEQLQKADALLDQQETPAGKRHGTRSSIDMAKETEADQAQREQEDAAMKIQKLQRARAARKKHARQKSTSRHSSDNSPKRASVQESDRHGRHHHHHHNVSFNDEEQVAATRIQSSLRARGARKEAEARRRAADKREAAATRIQASHRARKSKEKLSDDHADGKEHRSRRSQIEPEEEEETRQKEAAAVRIQSIHRGRRVRNEHSNHPHHHHHHHHHRHTMDSTHHHHHHHQHHHQHHDTSDHHHHQHHQHHHHKHHHHHHQHGHEDAQDNEAEKAHRRDDVLPMGDDDDPDGAKDREAAALKIQSLHRGRLARKEAKVEPHHHHHHHHKRHASHSSHKDSHHHHESHHHESHHHHHEPHHHESHHHSHRHSQKRGSKVVQEAQEDTDSQLNSQASHSDHHSRHRGSLR